MRNLMLIPLTASCRCINGEEKGRKDVYVPATQVGDKLKASALESRFYVGRSKNAQWPPVSALYLIRAQEVTVFPVAGAVASVFGRASGIPRLIWLAAAHCSFNCPPTILRGEWRSLGTILLPEVPHVQGLMAWFLAELRGPLSR